METFNKSERLCSLKRIEELFENGEIIGSPLLKIVWLKSPVPLSYPAQVAISVPKKKFRKAVERNLLRRRLREAYRKNKHTLYEELVLLDYQILFIIIFRGNNIPNYDVIEKNIIDIIKLLTDKIRKKLNLS